MTDTFTWRVHATASGGGKLTVNRARFGDGYSQAAASGLNPDIQTWRVTVSGESDEMKEVRDFIVEHVGQSFYWTPPMGEQGLYQCDGYNPIDQGSGYFTLEMEFMQVYQP